MALKKKPQPSNTQEERCRAAAEPRRAVSPRAPGRDPRRAGGGGSAAMLSSDAGTHPFLGVRRASEQLMRRPVRMVMGLVSKTVPARVGNLRFPWPHRRRASPISTAAGRGAGDVGAEQRKRSRSGTAGKTAGTPPRGLRGRWEGIVPPWCLLREDRAPSHPRAPARSSNLRTAALCRRTLNYL